jgi:transcriptional regulator with XRE-family HTH domain
MQWTGEKIKLYRKKRGLSQQALAKELGCRQQTVSEWETGIYEPGNAYSKVLTFLLIGDFNETQKVNKKALKGSNISQKLEPEETFQKDDWVNY